MSLFRAPRNTRSGDGAMEVFAKALLGESTTGDAILQQEADGQRSLATSDTLPTRMMGENDRQVLEQAGVVFGGVVPRDDMFTFVTLPEGWRKAPTGHSMWTDLVDEKGRKRASIFYKAAFYDRDAFMRTVTRFSVQKDYDYEDANNAIRINVMDGDQVVFTTVPRSFEEKYSPEWRTAEEAANKDAIAWLKQHYSKWQDSSAYWD